GTNPPQAHGAARGVGTADDLVVQERTSAHHQVSTTEGLDGTAFRTVYVINARAAGAPAATVTADSPVAGERAVLDSEGSKTGVCDDGAADAVADTRSCATDDAAIATVGLVGDESAVANGDASTSPLVRDGATAAEATIGTAEGLVADERGVANGKAARQI